MQKPQIVASIASSLVSPNLLSRKVAAEILVFFCHWDENNPDRVGLGLVLNAFHQLEQRLNSAVADLAKKVGRFDVWLRQLEQTIDGRGRMGSMVGVSKDLKGQDDSAIMDYCVSKMLWFSLTFQITMICLIQGLTSGNDIRARCSIRAQLETAGLLGVFYKVRQWNDEPTTRMIRQYEEEADIDRRELLEEQDQVVLQSMRSPEDVFRALLQMTRGSKASAYLLNSLRHLLLIKEEGDQKVRYFQLIDRLITSIILNDTPDLGQDFSRAFGTSVSQLISKFVEQERMDNAFQEVRELRAALERVTREKIELSEEINRDDLVASLKGQVAELEDRLRKSRAATEALTDQMEGMKRDYEARTSDLELIIQELFNMLRESHHLDEVQGLNDGPINRTQLMYDLREQWERKKTIRKLNGKDRAKRKTMRPGDTLNGNESDSDEDVEVLAAEKVAFKGEARGHARTVKAREKKALSGSQFMDAPDDHVRAHIEDALSNQADHIVSAELRFG